MTRNRHAQRRRSVSSSFASVRCHSTCCCCRSLAGPVRSARQHLDAVESFARSYVQRLPARSGEGDVGGLATQLDRAEIATLGIEYLHAGERGDVDTIAIVERKAVGAALLAGRN